MHQEQWAVDNKVHDTYHEPDDEGVGANYKVTSPNNQLQFSSMTMVR